MSRYHLYQRAAVEIIESAPHGKPLNLHLKKYFSSRHQIGARDRKQISSLCYNYYRCYHAFNNLILTEAILHSAFICSYAANELLAALAPEFNPYCTSSLEEKCRLLNIELHDFFPFRSLLCNDIDADDFIRSLLVQPDSFLRVRPGKMDLVKKALSNAGIEFVVESEHCIRFASGRPVDQAIVPDQDAVIQDMSSQQVFGPVGEIDPFIQGIPSPELWDACAASGGKSMLMHDLLSGIPTITVSDIRRQMIANLRDRFKRAGIALKKAVALDLTGNQIPFHPNSFDLIIADVPCTGSGTWARTPEQMAWFDPNQLTDYSTKQIQIVKNISEKLKPGGLLFYITCSAFEKENSTAIENFRNMGMRLIQSKIIPGYLRKSDTMFTAMLTRN